MTFTTDQIGKLYAPFDPSLVSWRIGAKGKNDAVGLALAYIDARDVMARLDEVCGPANWQCRYSHAAQKTICEIGIKIDDEWVWKANGAGDSDVEAEKGATSDAFKRAAVLWGIGRYLYDIESPWVEIKQQGRSFVIANHRDPKLLRALGAKAQPSQRATSNPQTPEEVSEVVDWAAEALELKQMIASTTTREYLNNLVKTARFNEFKDRAPDSLVKQVRQAVADKSKTYQAVV